MTLDLQSTHYYWSSQTVISMLNETSSINKTTSSTGSVLIVFCGKELNLIYNSPATAVSRNSALEKTLWRSDTSLVFKTARGIPTSFSLIGVTVASRSSQMSMKLMFWYPNVSSSKLHTPVPSPSTGSAGVAYLGFGGGTSEYSQRVRIMTTSCVASMWASDSAIKSKTSQGIGSDISVSISASGFVVTTASLFSFSTPTLSSFASRQLEIGLFGSGFGLNPSVFRRTENMVFGKRLEPLEKSVLIASDILMQDAVVSSMSVEVEFFNATRLDDVQVALKTQEREVVLLSSQCFGCTRSGNSVTLHFSDDGKSPAPTLLCDERSTYRPLLSSMKSLFVSTGFLQLFVIAGSTPLHIAAASINAELRLVDVSVSKQLASSMLWTSDSSLVFLLPPGAGPNQTVGVQAGGQSSNMLRGLSYPLPQIQPSKISDLAASGMALIEIVGQYFSYRSATVSVRFAGTTCPSTTWISDVTVICRNAAGGGSLRGVIASVEFLHSETISTGNSTRGSLIPFAFVDNVMKSATPWMATDSALFTGGMQIIVLGENIGVIDASFGMRIGVSSSRATLWFSDTSILNRVGQRSNGLNSPFVLSANSRQVGAKLVPDMQSLSFQIISVAPRNIARTGSSMLMLLGAHFALHPTSAAIRMGLSGHELSNWRADSVLRCKASDSRFVFQTDIVLSVLQASSPLYELPKTPSLSISPLEVSLTPIPFPTTMLEDLGNSFLISVFGEHFGTSNSIDFVEIDNKNCWPSLWRSDSSLICSMPSLDFESNRVQIRLKSQWNNEVTLLMIVLVPQ